MICAFSLIAFSFASIVSFLIGFSFVAAVEYLLRKDRRRHERFKV